MRKKQFMALFLTGALTVGMAPTAAFAAEDAQAVSIEGTADTAMEGSAETPAPEGETTPAPEENTEGETTPTPETPNPTEPVVPETPPTEAPTETPSEPTRAPEETPSEEETLKEETAVSPTPEAKEGNSITFNDTTYTTLKEAVEAAQGGTVETPSEIKVSGEFTVEETIVVTSGQVVRIVAQSPDTTITRGASLTGNMFQVKGGTLDFCVAVPETGTTETPDASATLTINGTSGSGDPTEGAIVAVPSGTFILESGVTLTGNTSSKEGGAVRGAAGSQIALAGGSITGNSATEGAGIYSEGTISVKGSVNVSGNQVYGGVEENNIALKGAGVITVNDKLEGSKIGVKFLEGKEGTPVIALAEGVTDVTLADVLPVFTYEGTDFTIDENGLLKALNTTPTPAPDTEPPVLTGKKMEWTGANSAKIVAVSNEDGWYYVDWVKKGEQPPELDLNKEGVPVQADRAFTIYLTELDSQHDIDVYVRVKDKSNNLSKKMLFQLKRENITPTPADREPLVPKVTESVVQGLENPLEFYPNTFYPFTVIGAGTNNSKPVKGDVKWVPLYWSTSSNPSADKRQTAWKIGSTVGIRDAATYSLYVFFQKYEYDGTQWQQTDVVESASYKFSSKAIQFNTATPTPTIQGQQGGDGTYYDPETGEPIDQTVDGDVTGATSNSDTVATGDETPIATMMMLATLSLLAGGYVLVRRRKKTNE